MMDDFTFDATQVSPAEEFKPLPQGEYVTIVSNAEYGPSKDGRSKVLKLELTVVEGQYKNRRLFEWLTLKSWNSQTEQIASAKFSSLCHSTGQLRFSNVGELQLLYGKPFLSVVAIRPAKDGYEEGNTVKAFKPLPNRGTVAQPAQPVNGRTIAAASDQPSAQVGDQPIGQTVPAQGGDKIPF